MISQIGTPTIFSTEIEGAPEIQAEVAINWAEVIEEHKARKTLNGHASWAKDLPEDYAVTENGVRDLNAWARDTIELLRATKPDRLYGSGIHAVIDGYRSVPSPKTLNRAVFNETMNAQAELLRFNLDLNMHSQGKISEQELENSKHSFTNTIAALLETTNIILSTQEQESKEILQSGEVITNSEFRSNDQVILDWAQYSTRILSRNTAEQLCDGAMKTIFTSYTDIPSLATSMSAEVVRAKMEAQARLLQFNLDLKSHLNGRIGEKEYEYSKQSAICALASVIACVS
jgi:hypothetical protein